jgi:hypothetical protein
MTEWALTDIANLIAEIDELKADNARLREALEWYADEARYETGETWLDGGVIASAALQGGKNE